MSPLPFSREHPGSCDEVGRSRAAPVDDAAFWNALFGISLAPTRTNLTSQMSLPRNAEEGASEQHDASWYSRGE
jgi:hypothetical protein